MPKTEKLPEEIEQLLFDSEDKPLPKQRDRLQSNLTFDPEELQPIPYYKKPLVQVAVLSVVAIPLIWLVFSAFNTEPSTSKLEKTTDPALENAQLLQNSLEKARKENQELTIDKGLRNQQTEFVRVRTAPSQKSIPRESVPTNRTVAVAPAREPVRTIRTVPISPRRTQSPPIRTIYVTRTMPAPAPSPTRSLPPPALEAPVPPRDPYELWLEQANRGLYFAPSNSSNSYVSPEPVVSADSSVTETDRPPMLPQLSQAISSDDLYSSSNSSQMLDLGSSAQAVLETGIAWTEDGKGQDRKVLLRLEQGFKNRNGVEILPEGTILIAQIIETSQSGLFSMEVTQILRDREKIPVPPGALQIVDEDGSPLKAELERKGGPSIWTKFGVALAPGVQQGMEALANTGENLILEDGDRSLIRSSGRSNPLASGLSGVADGTSRILLQELEQGEKEKAAPYFQFDSGKTVLVLANEDLIL